jgi:Carboxypeptidase regulatory-like domain
MLPQTRGRAGSLSKKWEGVMIGFIGRNLVRENVWLGLLLFPLLSFGQANFQAQIRGVVRDQSGAVILNAKVTITNVATNIPTSSQTDDRGYYIFNGLRPAAYTVTAEANGLNSIRNRIFPATP